MVKGQTNAASIFRQVARGVCTGPRMSLRHQEPGPGATRWSASPLKSQRVAKMVLSANSLACPRCGSTVGFEGDSLRRSPRSTWAPATSHKGLALIGGCEVCQRHVLKTCKLYAGIKRSTAPAAKRP
jgi:hypothetical protein